MGRWEMLKPEVEALVLWAGSVRYCAVLRAGEPWGAGGVCEGNGSRKRQSPHSQAGNCATESVPGAGESRRVRKGELGGLTGGGAGVVWVRGAGNRECYEGPHG